VSGEAGLLLLAWGLARWMELDPLRYLQLTGSATAWGIVATVPLLLGLAWLQGARTGPLRALLDLVVEQIGPYLARLSVMDLALLAVVAGFSEEVLFRGVLQVWLTPWFSTAGALMVSSLMFGLVHFASRTYAILAGAMGLYLGGLFLAQQNLLAPIVTHAVYDLVALLLVARLYRRRLAQLPG
jgi:membrane protease YdiL (CAAX protease family)